MGVHYVVEILIVLITYSTVAVKPTAIPNWDDPTRQPMVKYAQLFNYGASAYVRITNKTIDATTHNKTDPDTYLQIDMFGPTLRAIRSYQTGEYICHNPTTGYPEMKVIVTVSKHPACMFYKTPNKKPYTSYRSRLNKKWYLAFHFKGNKAGRPKKGQRTSDFKNKGCMFLLDALKLSRKRRKG
ncbi:fibroblast growth factor 18-like [Paramuricea clavata]|uniref:Fibroblast growth factor 18-like n=1 Tax=Paramuricea clavata TaxID=317549 RepID=A0A6S7GCR2_PARCT|nr:fibroblast growth factor 18-like [Paramuricea clavata]